MDGTGDLEWYELKTLIESVDPMPVVWMANPVESGGFDVVLHGKDEHLGFRVEAGDGWEQGVQTLISSASFVVMHNEKMTRGVLAEIAVLGEAGRLDDTFFEDAEAENQATNRVDCRPFDAAGRYESMDRGLSPEGDVD